MSGTDDSLWTVSSSCCSAGSFVGCQIGLHHLELTGTLVSVSLFRHGDPPFHQQTADPAGHGCLGGCFWKLGGQCLDPHGEGVLTMVVGGYLQVITAIRPPFQQPSTATLQQPRHPAQPASAFVKLSRHNGQGDGQCDGFMIPNG